MHELKGINGEPPSADDFLDVKDCALITERIVNALDHVAQFNLGDYLVARTDNKDYVRDAYGSVIKYRVLYIDKLGFPYIKRLSKNGRPTGFLYSMLDFSQLDYSDTTNLISVVPSNNSSRGSTLTYMIDPDYADAIIMGDIENYDPCAVLKSKSKLHREIAKHNKSISIRIDNPVKLNKFISNHIKVGASIWR
ncbi:MAG: hypothetical protein EB127_24880, partial [Alphaproteobacteria bacterium]|nr:hypothetical protein [Alphaproteobacteria bacterium]